MTQPTLARGSLLAAAVALSVVGTLAPRSAAQAPASPYAFLPTAQQIEAMRLAWNERLPYVPGEVLVRFKAGVETEGQVRALSAARARVDRARARWLGDTLWLQDTGDADAPGLASALARQPEVDWAQPNYWYTLKTTPNDPSYNRQWNLDLIDMPRAWDINGGAADSVTVAVLDSGTTTSTTSFSFPLWTGTGIETVSVPFRVNPDIGAGRIAAGRDFIFWTGPVLDMVGHGTHVAGTVLQETNNNLAFAGIAYRARLLPLKVCVGYWELQIWQSADGIPGYVDPRDEGGCSTSAIIQALRYAADNGAQVANISLGGPGASPAMLDAMNYAVNRGTFVAMAIGNEFEEGNPTEYPAAYGAQVEGAMSVGAVGRSSRRAFYSNTGSHLEIVAPGGDLRDGGLTGVVYQTSLFEDDFDAFTIIRPRFDRYADEPKQGTSMSTPHIAGVAALLFSQGINSPAAVEAAIRRFARDLGPAGRDDDFGHGLVDARAALRGLGAAR